VVGLAIEGAICGWLLIADERGFFN